VKKFITAILAIIYIGTATGVSVHLHYCMGKLVSWGLVDHESKHCMVCGMLKSAGHGQGIAKKDCCKDEHKLIQTVKDQKATSSNDLVVKCPLVSLVAEGGPLPDISAISLAVANPLANAPPGSRQVRLFLLTRSFRV
jgi:hypothetical protein